MDATEAPLGLALLYIEEKRFGNAAQCSGWPARNPATPTLLDQGDEKLCAEAFHPRGSLKIASRMLRPGNPALLAARHIAEQVAAIVKIAPNFYIFAAAKFWKDYLDGLESSFRHSSALSQAFSRATACALSVASASKIWTPIIKLFLPLHQMRSTAGESRSGFSSVERAIFIPAWALYRRGWLEFWLRLGSSVAAQFCLRYGDAVYLLQKLFRPKAHRGPGRLCAARPCLRR